MNADDTTASNLTATSPRAENQKGVTENVTDYYVGNATSSENGTTPGGEGSSAATSEAVNVNATTPAAGSATSSVVATSANGNASELEIERYETDANNGLHVIHPADAMSPGTYSLEIDYEILPDGRAIYSASFNESNEGK